MLFALSISLNTNAVLPHDVGPATMAVNGCIRGSMSQGTSRRRRRAIYTFPSSSSSPLEGRGRVRARARSAPSPVSVAEASRRDLSQMRQPVRRRITISPLPLRCVRRMPRPERRYSYNFYFFYFHVCCVEMFLLLFILVCVNDETVFDLYTYYCYYVHKILVYDSHSVIYKRSTNKYFTYVYTVRMSTIFTRSTTGENVRMLRW